MIVSPSAYNKYKEATVSGRYVVNEQLKRYAKSLGNKVSVKTAGYSVLKHPILSLKLGTGSKRILMWSQMHGNESTTTKAVFDLINFLTNTKEGGILLESCSVTILPILNPDGAEAYTRVNANQVDLNRDARERTQPESEILRRVYDAEQPDFCFNLHDQRTIYNVGNTSKPATVSFLAPSHDEVRSISKSRDLSMKLIVAMNKHLQALIPGQIGRYDDAFNANCVGDSFQMLETPTVLFEAGHFQKDYQREKTREFIFHALLSALVVIKEDAIASNQQTDYFNIPENQKQFYDVLISNIPNTASQHKDVGILYTEVLKEEEIHFIPKAEAKGNLEHFFGHITYDCQHKNELEKLMKTEFWGLISS